MKKMICVMLVLCSLLLSGCVISPVYLIKKDMGLYPTTADFPNTKWVCHEIDLCLYMFDYDESCIMGTYTTDGVSYRAVGSFWFGLFDFEIYSSTEISASEVSDSMIHCEQNSYGFIYTSYLFDKDTGTIVCEVVNYELSGKETIPQTLTFEKVGSIAEEPTMRWYAEEIDMYLDSYSDVDDYFRGEIIIDGEKCFVHGMEIGNDGYFYFSVENGKINNSMSGTTSPLIYMWLEIEDDQMIAKVSDEYLLDEGGYPYWSYNGIIITFKPLHK